MPGSELYVGLSTGAIDGVIYGGPMEYVGMKLFEVAKYYTKLNVLNPGYTDCLLMNMDKWNALSTRQNSTLPSYPQLNQNNYVMKLKSYGKKKRKNPHVRKKQSNC